MTGLRAESVATADRLAELAPDWWTLWQRSTAATPFQTPAWLIAWWRHFSPGELLTVAVWRGDRLVGLAPLYLEVGPRGRRLLPVGISLSDHLDVLLDPAEAEPAGAALIARLAAEAHRWDVLSLEDLAPAADALALPRGAGWADRTVPQTPCPVLALMGDGRAAVPAGKRAKIRLARNRAARRGGAVVRLAGSSETGGFVERLIGLHSLRWAQRGEAGVLADPRVRAFLRAAMPALQAAGLLRLYLLDIGGTPAGALCAMAHRGTVHAYHLGFDPAFAHEGPGTLLVSHAIERAVGEGARDFSFLRGGEPYKYSWGAEDRWNSIRTFRRAGPLDG